MHYGNTYLSVNFDQLPMIVAPFEAGTNEVFFIHKMFPSHRLHLESENRPKLAENVENRRKVLIKIIFLSFLQ